MHSYALSVYLDWAVRAYGEGFYAAFGRFVRHLWVHYPERREAIWARVEPYLF